MRMFGAGIFSSSNVVYSARGATINVEDLRNLATRADLICLDWEHSVQILTHHQSSEIRCKPFMLEVPVVITKMI